MKRNRGFIFLFSITCGFFACHSNNHGSSAQDVDSSGNKPISVNAADNIPEYRKEIRKEPVDAYREKTDNPLNDWYFSVKLFETAKTFQYLVKMQFEEVHGEDTLKLPNFGIEPKPVLKKGSDKYSCIIGFLDNDHVFREYKMVHVENGNQLKITTLKHYAVTAAGQ